MDIDVEMRGADRWAEPRVAVAVMGAQQDAVDAVAERLLTVVQGNMRTSFRHPTGYYYSRVVNERRGSRDRVVTDNGVIYGPWLEGVGKRNRTTRFKGYANFRRAGQQVEREAPAIAGPAFTAGLERRMR